MLANLDPHWGEGLGNYVTAGVGNYGLWRRSREAVKVEAPWRTGPCVIGEDDRRAYRGVLRICFRI